MDNSKNLEILDKSSGPNVNNMEFESYDSLFLSAKNLLTATNKDDILKSDFGSTFTLLLNNCETYLSKCLDFIINLLSNDRNNDLCMLMEDAATILQLLSNIIKIVVETIKMSCDVMHVFPVTTGNLLILVFTHCKESESLYGKHLLSVEKQLKELFRCCHELQQTYLMVMEQHFLFNFSVKEEHDVLIEALDINLKIGGIVQTLDVKTMAMQWKGYITICEKYCEHLTQSVVFENCTKVLCIMIESNITISLQPDQDEKIIIRSLKVSSFMLKILQKICNIFQNSNAIDFKWLLDLLIFIYLHNPSYLQVTNEKSPQVLGMLQTCVFQVADGLIVDLLTEDKFLNYVLEAKIGDFEIEEDTFSWIILLTTIAKNVIPKYDKTHCTVKLKLINCVLDFLPNGHIWFNIGMKFNCDGVQDNTFGFYEYLLSSSLTLASTLESEQYNALTKRLYELLMSTNSWSGLFASDLWVMLSRLAKSPLILNQLVNLCKIYQKLEPQRTFLNSPQQVHLCFTIKRLFQIMPLDDKMNVCRVFSVNDENNTGLWIILELRYLPDEVRVNAEKHALDKLKQNLCKSNSSLKIVDIENLIKSINLSATCSSPIDSKLKMEIVNCWMKTCPESNKIMALRGSLDLSMMWYLDFIKALVKLTNNFRDHLFSNNSANIIKILHVISSLIQSGSAEVKLALIDLFVYLSSLEIHESHINTANDISTKTLETLLAEENLIISKFFSSLKMHAESENLHKLIRKVLNESHLLYEIWCNFLNISNEIYIGLNQTNILKEKLRYVLDENFEHKCLKSRDVIELSGKSSSNDLTKSLSNNFDMTDIDVLFDGEICQEPANKKIKLNHKEVDDAIVRLEKDVILLNKLKEDVPLVDYKDRIELLCSSLRNVVS